MTNVGLFYLYGGIFLILLALPLYFGKVKPNPFYGFGFFTRNTDVWYAVNKVSAGWMIVTGVLTVFITIALAFVPNLSADAYENTCTVIFWGGITIGGIATWKYMIDRL